MKADDLLKQLLPILGDKGLQLIEGQVRDLAEGQGDWQKTALSLVAEAVVKFGPGGVKIATDAVSNLLDGKHAKLDWADLATASDVLAQFQNAEADRKSEMQAYLAKIGQVTGIILAAVIKGLI